MLLTSSKRSPLSNTIGVFFFFFNDTATTEIYTLSLHDALPICRRTAGRRRRQSSRRCSPIGRGACVCRATLCRSRSEEHTSELQSLAYLVCRLLLEKKKGRTRRRWSALYRLT